MDVILLAIRLLLATVFLVAGIAKLVDHSGSRRALGDFGTPRRLVPLLSIMLPPAELAIGVALLPRATARWAAFGALTLLVVFGVAIGANLAKGRRPVCRCFGQVHGARVGWSTLARNAGLAALAGLIVQQGRQRVGTSAVGWVRGLSPDERIGIGAGMSGFALLAIQGWMLLYLLRRYGTLLKRIDSDNIAGRPIGLVVGTPAPAFELPDLSGELVSLDALLEIGRPVALVFVDLNCPHCVDLLPELGRWQRVHAADLTTAVIGPGDVQALGNASAEHGLTQVLVREDEELVDAYRIRGNPAAVLVHPDGTIDSPVALGTSAIRDLIAGRLKQRSPRRSGEETDRAAVRLARPSLDEGAGAIG
jgi:uncharacterized membrane protein YphA (DoxX/SURF4 family)/peroxiredoxin